MDAQTTIKRVASEEHSPGQMYAVQAMKHIEAVRARAGIITEIRWCPAHEDILGNEKPDEWAKLAAAEPDANDVE
jgi:ribonuclease HI